ncbi:LTA synthase family protein [Flavihumibacter stibioxidans]|nr:alkaline phosphatase family protein [Flavihumibacter stibioxidans]
MSISFLTRLALLVYSAGDLSWSPVDIVSPFLIGLLYDAVAALYFSIPMLLVVGLVSQRFLNSRPGRIFSHTFFILNLLVLLFNALSEWLFWNEFAVRYNFIAVDYLIYTNEVWKNIQQSYPLPAIFSGLALITFLSWFAIRKTIHSKSAPAGIFSRLGFIMLVVAAGLLNFFLVDDGFRNFSANKLNNELAGNGLYQFGNAFRKNSMPYLDFYANQDEHKVFKTLRQLLREPGANFTGKSETDLTRHIEPAGKPEKYNVVLISIESLSAEFLGYFEEYHNRQYPEVIRQAMGYIPKITPTLDSLVNESIFFTNLYASGTRTVRGLEALSTGLPPTPGQSVVKRLPTSSGLFTIGEVLKQNGYDCKYVYGGNSYFDNMGDFFGKNGYEVVDEDAIPADSIHHETAWGVCDEDLYTQAIKEMDKSYGDGKPFFEHIMTVSHHRPYTYPEGRVSIPPSMKLREGSLQYTDYAVDKFLKEAKNKPWFKHTVFVIIADHCASSSGRTDMPLNRYHIPAWIFAPGIVKPQKFERLTSQIDIPPTILGLLNLPYESKFFGYDMFRLENGRERLLLVNYQDIAYVKNGKMVVLSPRKEVRMYEPEFRTGNVKPIPMDTQMKEEAISYFQGAAWMLDHGSFKF